MSREKFDRAMGRAIDAFREAGVVNYAIVAFNPADNSETGGVALQAQTPADNTAIFHTFAETMFPTFATMNGLPSQVAAGAMCELVALAAETAAARRAAASEDPVHRIGVGLGFGQEN